MTAARTLVLAILGIQSSYLHDLEEAARGSPDTLQWWIGGGSAWRIRTFVLDRDIHVRNLLLSDTAARELAEMQARTTYGGVLAELHVIEIEDPDDEAGCATALRGRGLEGSIVADPAGFAYWSPDGERYSARTRTE